MHGQGTYMTAEGLDFRCAFTVSWFDIETGSPVDGCSCNIRWSSKYTFTMVKFDNSLTVDCPCVGPFNAVNYVPQAASVVLQDNVHKIV